MVETRHNFSVVCVHLLQSWSFAYYHIEESLLKLYLSRLSLVELLLISDFSHGDHYRSGEI